MRKLLARHIFRLFILAAALFCWYRALASSGDMIKAPNSVSLRYGTGGLSRAAVERMLEEERVPFAAWLQKDGQTVGEPEFSREAGVHVLEVAGDAELVLPAEELLAGFFPVRGCMDTCAVDAATAYALWGGTDVLGETLTYSGMDYLVTGVFKRPESTILLQGGLETDMVYPLLEISVSGANASRRQAEEFRSRYSLPEPDILIDNAETAAMLRQLALFPAFIFSALTLWLILRRIFGKPASFSGRACFVTAMAAGIFLTAWATGFSIIIPSTVIPGRWSDFSFWARLIKNAGEGANLNREFSWPVPDILRWQKQRFLLFYTGVALAGWFTLKL